MPPNTTSLIQPMDQRVIATFKAYYLRKTFSQAFTATNSEENMTLRKFWTGYNIYMAVKNIGSAWEEVTQKTMTGAWRKVLEKYEPTPESENLQQPEEDVIRSTTEEIAELGKEIGLDEINAEDMEELICNDREALSNEDLMELGKEQGTPIAKDDTIDNEEPLPSLTVKGLQTAFEHFEKMCDYFRENDPDNVRSSKVIRNVEHELNCYKAILNEIKKPKRQILIHSFFNPKKPKVDEAGPSQ